MLFTTLGVVLIVIKAKTLRPLPGFEIHFLFGWFVLIFSTLGQFVLGIVATIMREKSRRSPLFFPAQIHWFLGHLVWIMALFNVRN